MTTKFARTVAEPPVKRPKPTAAGKSGAFVAEYKNGLRAIIKLAVKRNAQGKTTQRDLEVRSQPRREVAFYRLAQLLGFEERVPETVLTRLDHTEASAQLFVRGKMLSELEPRMDHELATENHAEWSRLLRKTCHRAPQEEWLQLLILDLIAASRDRHANNAGLLMSFDDQQRPVWHVVGWDNACAFGLTFDRYHNVFHKNLFRYTVNLSRYWPLLERLTMADFNRALSDYLDHKEVRHAYLRLQWVLEYSYKLPWKLMSGGLPWQGNDNSNGFPSYSDFFTSLTPQRLASSLAVVG